MIQQIAVKYLMFAFGHYIEAPLVSLPNSQGAEDVESLTQLSSAGGSVSGKRFRYFHYQRHEAVLECLPDNTVKYQDIRDPPSQPQGSWALAQSSVDTLLKARFGPHNTEHIFRRTFHNVWHGQRTGCRRIMFSA